MPEFRKDPIVDRWVIIAKSRAARPHDFETTPRLRSATACPFCEGNEASTPAEILAVRAADSLPNRAGWQVRVVPNKFPALEGDGEFESRADDLYETLPGIGAHEVIIESPRHLLSTADLSAGHLATILNVYRDRLTDLRQDRRLAYALIFKNVGEAAGASLEHVHSQLIATPMVPVEVRAELVGSQQHFSAHGSCIYCDMVARELATGQRVVAESPGFLAFCPYASRSPGETWILPKGHTSHYENVQPHEVVELARMLKDVSGKIETALDRPAYNYFLHTGPFDTQELNHYHWHIEMIPRLTKIAGFEWGSGFFINPVPPEEAAALLREVELDTREPQTLPVKEIG